MGNIVINELKEFQRKHHLDQVQIDNIQDFLFCDQYGTIYQLQQGQQSSLQLQQFQIVLQQILKQHKINKRFKKHQQIIDINILIDLLLLYISIHDIRIFQFLIKNKQIYKFLDRECEILCNQLLQYSIDNEVSFGISCKLLYKLYQQNLLLKNCFLYFNEDFEDLNEIIKINLNLKPQNQQFKTYLHTIKSYILLFCCQQELNEDIENIFEKEVRSSINQQISTIQYESTTKLIENKIFEITTSDSDDIKLFKDSIQHKIHDIQKYKKLSQVYKQILEQNDIKSDKIYSLLFGQFIADKKPQFPFYIKSSYQNKELTENEYLLTIKENFQQKFTNQQYDQYNLTFKTILYILELFYDGKSYENLMELYKIIQNLVNPQNNQKQSLKTTKLQDYKSINIINLLQKTQFINVIEQNDNVETKLIKCAIQGREMTVINQKVLQYYSHFLTKQEDNIYIIKSITQLINYFVDSGQQFIKFYIDDVLEDIINDNNKLMKYIKSNYFQYEQETKGELYYINIQTLMKMIMIYNDDIMAQQVSFELIEFSKNYYQFGHSSFANQSLQEIIQDLHNQLKIFKQITQSYQKFIFNVLAQRQDIANNKQIQLIRQFKKHILQMEGCYKRLRNIGYLVNSLEVQLQHPEYHFIQENQQFNGQYDVQSVINNIYIIIQFLLNNKISKYHLQNFIDYCKRHIEDIFNSNESLQQIFGIKIGSEINNTLIKSFSIYLLNNMNNTKLVNKLCNVLFNNFINQKISIIIRRQSLLFQFYPDDPQYNRLDLVLLWCYTIQYLALNSQIL